MNSPAPKIPFGDLKQPKADGNLKQSKANGNLKQSKADGNLKKSKADGNLKQSKADGILDPLFDYSRMQPQNVFLDDDDEDDVQILAPSKLHTLRSLPTSLNLEVNDGKENVPVQAVKPISDTDWLEAPPSRPGCHRVLPENPTLLKLRQEKEELQRIWQRSEAMKKTTEESLKLAAARATVPLPGGEVGGGVGVNVRSQNADSVQAPSKRQKILLKLQAQTGHCESVRIFKDDKLERLFTHYANNIGKRPMAEFVFRFDGQQLNANSCPKDLDLEDEDIVEVFVKGARR